MKKSLKNERTDRKSPGNGKNEAREAELKENVEIRLTRKHDGTSEPANGAEFPSYKWVTKLR